jgi:hypothetical protein
MNHLKFNEKKRKSKEFRSAVEQRERTRGMIVRRLPEGYVRMIEQSQMRNFDLVVAL